MGKVALVIAPENFRDEELFHTKESLEKAGHKTTIFSAKTGKCSGLLGGSADAEKTIDELKANDFDAVAFIGGMGAQIYLNDKKAHAIAKEFLDRGKILSAICIAPGILANAGLLKGKKATCTPGQVGNLKKQGAIYTGSGVEVDGKIITADGPRSAHKFGEAIAKMI